MAREHRVTAAIDVHAPVEVLWDVLGRFADYEDWLESTTEVLRADDEVVVGAGFEERSRISGVWMATIRWTLTELEPDARMVFRGEGVWAVDGLGFSVDLAEHGHSTELSLTLWYTPRFGPLGSALDVLTRSNVTNDQKRTVRTLATLAERRAHRDEPSEAD
ncbi:MAG TPA: SRPBCC family protein [Acidimicrobiales bacterium]|nr:SRPBCC family protein [Acidimicrobiales bacterium]